MRSLGAFSAPRLLPLPRGALRFTSVCLGSNASHLRIYILSLPYTTDHAHLLPAATAYYRLPPRCLGAPRFLSGILGCRLSAEFNFHCLPLRMDTCTARAPLFSHSRRWFQLVPAAFRCTFGFSRRALRSLRFFTTPSFQRARTARATRLPRIHCRASICAYLACLPDAITAAVYRGSRARCHAPPATATAYHCGATQTLPRYRTMTWHRCTASATPLPVSPPRVPHSSPPGILAHHTTSTCSLPHLPRMLHCCHLYMAPYLRCHYACLPAGGPAARTLPTFSFAGRCWWDVPTRTVCRLARAPLLSHCLPPPLPPPLRLLPRHTPPRLRIRTLLPPAAAGFSPCVTQISSAAPPRMLPHHRQRIRLHFSCLCCSA